MGMTFRADSLAITPETLTLISEIEEFKGAWRALGTLAPERLSALRRVATIESIGSSTRIEGSRLSDEEVARLLSNLEIETFGRIDRVDGGGTERWIAAPIVGDCSLHRRVLGDPSVPGWQWTAVTHPDDASVTARLLHLCSVQLARERYRENKGAVLPRTASDPGNDPQRDAELATVDRIFSERASKPKTAIGDEDSARASDDRYVAGTLATDP